MVRVDIRELLGVGDREALGEVASLELEAEVELGAPPHGIDEEEFFPCSFTNFN